MQKFVSPEQIARLKRAVPKGQIKVVELPPFAGQELQPLSAKDLGTAERKAA